MGGPGSAWVMSALALVRLMARPAPWEQLDQLPGFPRPIVMNEPTCVPPIPIAKDPCTCFIVRLSSLQLMERKRVQGGGGGGGGHPHRAGNDAHLPRLSARGPFPCHLHMLGRTFFEAAALPCGSKAGTRWAHSQTHFAAWPSPLRKVRFNFVALSLSMEQQEAR